MKTVGEIDRTGKVVRIFHRTATSAWDHAPGERYRFRTRTRDEKGRGRQVWGWVEMRCDCEMRTPEKAPQDAGDEYAGPSAAADRRRGVA